MAQPSSRGGTSPKATATRNLSKSRNSRASRAKPCADSVQSGWKKCVGGGSDCTISCCIGQEYRVSIYDLAWRVLGQVTVIRYDKYYIMGPVGCGMVHMVLSSL